MTPVIAATLPEVFGARHLTLLGVAAVLCVVVTLAARLLRHHDAAPRIVGIAGWLLLVASVVWMGWWMLPGNWDIGRSLPLHYSDVLRIAAAIALIRGSRWAVAITWYWGLTLNTQALLTPHSTQLRLSPVEFPFYWGLHIAVLVVAVALVWGLGHRPVWRDLRIAFGAALLWAGLVMALNAWLGTNYGFLNAHPPGASVLDLLGPWPIFLIWEAVLIAAVWSLMTWAVMAGQGTLRGGSGGRRRDGESQNGKSQPSAEGSGRGRYRVGKNPRQPRGRAPGGTD